MIHKKPLVVAVAAACVFSNLVFAQTQPSTQKVEKIEVTGSNIKRIDAEGANPIEVINREEIQRRGVTSTNDLLRSLSYMSSFNDELIANSPETSGAAGAGFRGLNSDQTVILLNGRRLAPYGFDGAYVNLNSLPIGAIERVEVLKDGAAAIYGADAIGGVINFITRRDYQGTEVQASYGLSSRSDSNELSLSATSGFGNLAKQGFNVLANVSYFKRDPIMNLDRERTRTADYRRFGGGNQLSTSSPTGNFVNPITGLQSPLTPCPDPSLIVTPSPLSGSGSSCVFDFAPYRTTLSGTERFGGMLTAKYRINDALQLFAEGLFTRSESFFSAAPAPGNFTLPVGHPANSFDVPIVVRGRPLQAGPRTNDNTADASRFLLGVEGSVASVDYNIALGQAKNRATNVSGGFFIADKLFAAVADRSFNPFSLNNPQSVIDALKSTDVRRGETTNSFLEAKLSTEIGSLPGGPVGLAAGIVFGKEEIADIPGLNLQRGNVFGAIQQAIVVADRSLFAAYAELNAPIVTGLEAQLALRHDRYEGGSRATTPKIALRYQPTQSILLRASYSEGFKMPSLRDLFGGMSQSADSVQDTPGCVARNQNPCPRLQYDRFSGGNSALKAEQAKGMNFGVQFEPIKSSRLGVDYFMINKTDEIGLVLAQFVIDSVPYAAGTTTTLGGNPAFSVTRNAGGTIQNVRTALGNLGERKIRGFDVNAEQRFPTAIGQFSLEGTLTYYTKYDYADLPGAPMYSRIGYLNLPRWRSQLRAGWRTEAWDLNAYINSRASMWDRQQSQANVGITATTPVVGSFDTLDLSLAYRGIKNLKITGIVKNVLDKEPPFANNDPRTYGFSIIDDIRGRYFSLGATYSF